MLEAPDDEPATAAILHLGAMGNAYTFTCRAFTAAEMNKIVAKVHGGSFMEPTGQACQYQGTQNTPLCLILNGSALLCFVLIWVIGDRSGIDIGGGLRLLNALFAPGAVRLMNPGLMRCTASSARRIRAIGRSPKRLVLPPPGSEPRSHDRP
jgi:hypothetical protein